MNILYQLQIINQHNETEIKTINSVEFNSLCVGDFYNLTKDDFVFINIQKNNKRLASFIMTSSPKHIKHFNLITYSRADSPDKSLDLFDDSFHYINAITLNKLIEISSPNKKLKLLTNIESHTCSILVAHGTSSYHANKRLKDLFKPKPTFNI